MAFLVAYKDSLFVHADVRMTRIEDARVLRAERFYIACISKFGKDVRYLLAARL